MRNLFSAPVSHFQVHPGAQRDPHEQDVGESRREQGTRRDIPRQPLHLQDHLREGQGLGWHSSDMRLRPRWDRNRHFQGLQETPAGGPAGATRHGGPHGRRRLRFDEEGEFQLELWEHLMYGA